MTIRVVRLGSERLPGEGLRIGTVRHPPRAETDSEWREFERAYRKEMSKPEARHALELLADHGGEVA